MSGSVELYRTGCSLQTIRLYGINSLLSHFETILYIHLQKTLSVVNPSLEERSVSSRCTYTLLLMFECQIQQVVAVEYASSICQERAALQGKLGFGRQICKI